MISFALSAVIWYEAKGLSRGGLDQLGSECARPGRLKWPELGTTAIIMIGRADACIIGPRPCLEHKHTVALLDHQPSSEGPGGFL